MLLIGIKVLLVLPVVAIDDVHQDLSFFVKDFLAALQVIKQYAVALRGVTALQV